LGVRVAHAIVAAENLPPAVRKQRGHNALLIAASTIYRGFALPRVRAEQILVKEYNPRCQPPWSSREIAHKLDAAERGGGPVGGLISAILISDAAVEVANENAAKKAKKVADASAAESTALDASAAE